MDSICPKLTQKIDKLKKIIQEKYVQKSINSCHCPETTVLCSSRKGNLCNQLNTFWLLGEFFHVFFGLKKNPSSCLFSHKFPKLKTVPSYLMLLGHALCNPVLIIMFFLHSLLCSLSFIIHLKLFVSFIESEIQRLCAWTVCLETLLLVPYKWRYSVSPGIPPSPSWNCSSYS